MGEILIGRRGRLSPYSAMREVALAEGRSPRWRWVGGINLLAAFIVEVVYCVVAGWVLYYLYVAVMTGFSGVDAEASSSRFTALLTDIPALIGWTVIGLLLTGAIIYAGVQKGIERAVRMLMPTLFVLLVVLACYNAFAGGFGAAADYLFRPDMSKVTAGHGARSDRSGIFLGRCCHGGHDDLRCLSAEVGVDHPQCADHRVRGYSGGAGGRTCGVSGGIQVRPGSFRRCWTGVSDAARRLCADAGRASWSRCCSFCCSPWARSLRWWD